MSKIIFLIYNNGITIYNILFIVSHSYLEQNPTFYYPLTKEGYAYLDFLGIKKHVENWIYWHEKMLEVLESKKEDEKLIKKFKLMLEKFEFI